jgi:hypothetical protein
VSRSKIIVEQHFSLTEQRLKVLAKTLSWWVGVTSPAWAQTLHQLGMLVLQHGTPLAHRGRFAGLV